MRIQHNIAALNSHRQLTTNNSSVAKNLEKLSSGYRINRAGDDAAGLAISEKMRAQITGLNAASKNAQDGISLVQTAEGALTEVHSMLNRMTELADQSANGTYQDAVDRENLQKEMDSLRGEIDRISQGTNFNGIKLLDGSMGGATVKSVQGGEVGGNEASFTIDLSTVVGNTGIANNTNFTIGNLTIAGSATTNSLTAAMAEIKTRAEAATITINNNTYTAKVDGNNLTLTSADKVTTNETAASIAGTIQNNATAATAGDVTTVTNGTDPTIVASTAKFTFNTEPKSGETLEIGAHKYQFVKTGEAAQAGFTAIEMGANLEETLDALQTELTANNDFANISVNGSAISLELAANNNPGNDPTAKIEVKQQVEGLKLQIGDTAEDFNQLSVTVGSMSAEALEIDGISVATQEDAKAAIDVIKNAINTVSSTRGDLGAIQNRLEHTVNNLGVTSENMTAAESRIRDVDMAQEMMAFTKNNILTQASQSMLAQANQLPQGVLQLLQ